MLRYEDQKGDLEDNKRLVIVIRVGGTREASGCASRLSHPQGLGRDQMLSIDLVEWESFEILEVKGGS
jgi:hypothetical protein